MDFSTGHAAAFWGFVAGSALLIGASVGYLVDVPRRMVAGIMAFGAGVLFSALSFDLMEEALARGGVLSTALGFVTGAVIYTAANLVISRRGARHRKRAGDEQAGERSAMGDDSGLAIAVGSVLDGIPESIAIGLTMIEGGVVSVAAVVAIFLSNLPEGLSSATGMRRAGRSPRFVLGVWSAAVVVFFQLNARVDSRLQCSVVRIWSRSADGRLPSPSLPSTFAHSDEVPRPARSIVITAPLDLDFHT